MAFYRKVAVVAALIIAPLLTIGSMTAAEASTHHFRHHATAQGHVALSGPLQFANFAASASQRGFISYTNFQSPATSNVWNISGAKALTFMLGGSKFDHVIDSISITPLSPVSSAFRGTGHFTGNVATTWTIHGFVFMDHISFKILYTGGPDAGYHLRAHGHIAGNGSVSGTALDSNGQTLTFTMPAGSATSVLHYHARVTCAFIRPFHHHHHHGGNATFGFTIPSTAPANLAGTPVVVKVHDGGFGATSDTWAHGVATSPCHGPVTQFPITSGDIIVRR